MVRSNASHKGRISLLLLALAIVLVSTAAAQTKPPVTVTAKDYSAQSNSSRDICIDDEVAYSTDHEDGSANWTSTVDANGVNNPWVLNTDGGASGSNYWFVDDITGNGSYSDSYLDSPTVSIPGGALEVYLSFTHKYSLEEGYDGGVVEVSVNGGPFTYLPNSAFTAVGYNAPISSCCLNPLAGLEAFTLTNPDYPNYSVSEAVLPAVAGDDIVVRFREANDFSVSDDGWYLDDVEVSYCVASITETPTETPDVTNTPTETPTETPTDTPDVTETPIPSDTPTEEPTADVTNTPEEPTATATATELPGTELIGNGDFEVLDGEGKPDVTPWVVKNSSGDKAKCNKDKDGDGIPDKIFANTGNCAFVFKGVAGDAGKLEQTLDLTGVTLGVGDALNLTFAAQTKGGGLGKSKTVFKYGDGTKTKISVDITDTTDLYAPFAGSETLTSTDVTKAKINFKMTTEAGKVYVDGISLRLVSAGGGGTPTEEPTVEATPSETPAARLNGTK